MWKRIWIGVKYGRIGIKANIVFNPALFNSIRDFKSEPLRDQIESDRDRLKTRFGFIRVGSLELSRIDFEIICLE